MVQKKKRKITKRQKQRIIVESIILFLALVGAITLVVLAAKGIRALFDNNKVVEEMPEMDVELLTVNDYSRPGIALDEVNAIVIHYTANPGTTAIQNRNYFEGLKDSQETRASSHFIVGLDGEIVQCIPTQEISYASNDRNNDSIAIECCHPDDTGQFNDSTYNTLIHLTAWLCGKYGLTTEDVIRHYDITGKDCPKYYVENEDAWKQFLKDVDDYIDEYGVKQ